MRAAKSSTEETHGLVHGTKFLTTIAISMQSTTLRMTSASDNLSCWFNSVVGFESEKNGKWKTDPTYYFSDKQCCVKRGSRCVPQPSLEAERRGGEEEDSRGWYEIFSI